ncbi:MAG: acyltransferase [Isosphaeraceae bacterium]
MRRVPELDSLRGLAALHVVLYHYWGHTFPIGWTAVELFFVLSGYLITTIILKHHDSDQFMSSFYARRALRIWPIYYLVILALLGLNSFFESRYPVGALPYFLSFTQNIQFYWSNTIPDFLGPRWFAHAWTLAIEEQFYLIWPALICLAGRKYLIPLTAVFVVIPVWARSSGFNRVILLARSDGFALGGLLAAVLYDEEQLRRRSVEFGRTLGLAGLAGAALLVAGTAFLRLGHSTLLAAWETIWSGPKIFAYDLMYFAIVGLTICYSGHPMLQALRDRRCCYLGQISYGFYLYHMPILVGIGELCLAAGVGRPVWVEFLALAASIAIASISWKYFEKPILRLKDRFEYGPAKMAARLP